MGYPAVFKPPIRSGDAVRVAKATKARSEGMRAASDNRDTENVKEDRLENGEASVKCDERGKVRKFLSTARRKGMDVVPEPEGRPLFLFFAAKGRNKPVQVFFDNGCSDAVMREGVPGVEWRGCWGCWFFLILVLYDQGGQIYQGLLGVGCAQIQPLSIELNFFNKTTN